MKTKTQDLTGPALDWAVAKCDGLEIDGDGPIWFGDHPHYNEAARVAYAPSTDWSQGGPIIERENITLTARTCERDWVADIGMNYEAEGPTPLIAAMRCFVANKLGDTIDLPEGLL